MSVASFQILDTFPTLQHISRLSSCGVEPLILRLKFPNFASAGGPDQLDVEDCQFRIAGLLCHALPHRADGNSAFHHSGARWQRDRILSVKRRDAVEIALY